MIRYINNNNTLNQEQQQQQLIPQQTTTTTTLKNIQTLSHPTMNYQLPDMTQQQVQAQVQVQQVPLQQQIISQYAIPTVTNIPISYQQTAMGPTALTNKLLSMIPSQISQSQLTIPATSIIQQHSQDLTNNNITTTANTNNIFKKSYIYNNNIPVDANVTTPSTPYNSISYQDNKIGRILPPPNTAPINSYYTSRSNTSSIITTKGNPISQATSRCSSNSLNGLRSFSNVNYGQKTSLSQSTISSESSSHNNSLYAPQPLINNNTSSSVLPNTYPMILSTTPISYNQTTNSSVITTLKDVHTTSCNQCSPCTSVNDIPDHSSSIIDNQDTQRRHSITLAGLNVKEENQNDILISSNKNQRNSHTDLSSLARENADILTGNANSTTVSPFGKITKPCNEGERYNNKGQLIGKSGKLLRDTKRAAQNRYAQKAFRLRREKYIKDLEEKAKRYDEIIEENDRLKKMVELLERQRKYHLEQSS